MKTAASFFFLLLPVIFYSCNDVNQPVSMKDMDPETIYFDYRVTGEEGYDKLTIWVQFRYGGPDGEPVLLEEPAKVELDGEIFPADSSGITGPFYELHKPISAFAGKHTLTFTGFNKKQYKEKFEFRPLMLFSALPDTLYREDIKLDLSGLDDEDSVRVLLTDTSSYNDGINEIVNVFKGRLILRQSELEDLAHGPVQLELVMEKESPLKNRTEEGGRLLIIYSLKREFFLRD